MTSFARVDAARASGIAVPIRPERTLPSAFGRSRVRRPDHPARLPRLNRERGARPLPGSGSSRSGQMSVQWPANRRNPAEGPLELSASAARGAGPPRRRPPRRAHVADPVSAEAALSVLRAGRASEQGRGAGRARRSHRSSATRSGASPSGVRSGSKGSHAVTSSPRTAVRHPLRASGGTMALTSSPGPRLAGSLLSASRQIGGLREGRSSRRGHCGRFRSRG